MERSEGPLLGAGRRRRRTLTGIERVLPRDEFDAAAKALAGRDRLHDRTAARRAAPARRTAKRRTPRARKADPWDSQPSREEWFMTKLREQAPRRRVREPRPILDEMRMIKSPREIALLRESTRIAGAGDDGSDALGASPGCTSTRSRRSRDYVFKKHNAQGHRLLRAGRGREERRLAALSRRAGADRRRATSCCSTTRPTTTTTRPTSRACSRSTASSPPDQRELYGIYVKLYQAIDDVDPSGPGRRRSCKDVVKKMDAVDGVVHVHEPEEQGGGARASSRATARRRRTAGRGSSATWSAWKSTT